MHKGSTGRFLEIACGLGETVALLRDRGWQAEGVDIDASTKPFHDRLGIRTQIGRFENIDIAGQFDWIHIAHAIYFISEPMGFLQRLRGSLSPGGLFTVAISDFLAATDDARPTYAHTFYPTGASMRHALALAGFVPGPARNSSGSIYIASHVGSAPAPAVNTGLIRLGYASKSLRYRLYGRPYLAARQLAKRVLGR